VTIGVLTTISLLITGMVLLIFDVVIDRAEALVWTVGIAAFTVGAVAGIPHLVGRDR
jgi:hypothetical protein